MRAGRGVRPRRPVARKQRELLFTCATCIESVKQKETVGSKTGPTLQIILEPQTAFHEGKLTVEKSPSLDKEPGSLYQPRNDACRELTRTAKTISQHQPT